MRIKHGFYSKKVYQIFLFLVVHTHLLISIQKIHETLFKSIYFVTKRHIIARSDENTCYKWCAVL